ncbi:MAG: hypothetical protein KAS23_08580 [Anaerohalosphaera sp.]|nr:hypothetical protein [Anaerohalosphaera sp.]
MSYSEKFDIGYLKIRPDKKEEVFLSVTPNMQYGPGIQRDGITNPRMTDPHTVSYVMDGIDQQPEDKNRYPATENAYVQRAGTWSLFDHVKKFIKDHEDYTVIGVQSCGDLTMNPWHIAFISEKDGPSLYHLDTAGDPGAIKEPINTRTYRCLVKWKTKVDGNSYDFLDLKFEWLRKCWVVILKQDIVRYNKATHKGVTKLEKVIVRSKEDRITDEIEFALSGKQIVEKGHDISLSSAIDQFQDVRHVFNVPVVNVRNPSGKENGTINFGEHVLFHDLNARRGALAAPIIIDLSIPNRMDIVIRYEDVEDILVNKYHYKKTENSPARRGEFRKYNDTSIEIFYRHNVYPFGVLGYRKGEIVCLSSGGLSGRVGNTLDGIIRIMFDFFASEDAIVLDEGFDTFHIINPNTKQKHDEPDNYKYDNEMILREVAAYTLWRMGQDQKAFHKMEIKKDVPDQYKIGLDMWGWPLNKRIYKNVHDYCKANKIMPTEPEKLDAMVVKPLRSQMRSVLVFAVRKDNSIVGIDSENKVVSSKMLKNRKKVGKKKVTK